MKITKHIGIVAFMFLVCLESRSVCAERSHVALFNYGTSVLFLDDPEIPQTVLTGQGRQKRGFGDTDTGNRATKTTQKTTPSPPSVNPDMISSTTRPVSKTTLQEVTTIETITTDVSTTSGDNSTVTTEQTNAGHVITEQYTYIPLLLVTIAYILL